MSASSWELIKSSGRVVVDAPDTLFNRLFKGVYRGVYTGVYRGVYTGVYI